ncbi:OmpA family protein [Flavobacterium sp. DG1-102-2]|uniref:OmpA family protein n=1 Tax=Flavobacterium sp. DG1-102-2 TaxID=3081663 RepID=UPI002948E533|nr:OmpA family protein [Flavobacterium sp. DG1-102-2]MDV6167858.1 OmpA family protein [Flavobacterium sp. DG1-102-2]
MKRKIFLLSLLLCATAGFSQSKLRKADRLFAEYAYVDAAKEYEKYLADAKEPGIETIKNAGDAYYYTGNTASALRWYSKLDGFTAGEMDDKYFNRYIQSLKAEGNHQKAYDLTKKRLDAKGDQAAITRLISQKKYLDSLNAAPPNYKLTNLAINTDKSDFGAAFYGNQVVYSSSKDTTKVGGKTYSWTDQPFLELFVADRNASDGSLFNDKKFISGEQTQYHNATVTFSPDNKMMFYSANVVKKNDRLNNAKEGTNNFEIIKGNLDGDKLTNVEKLPFNSKEYSVGHPALSSDGKWLYFVSDMPGGLGETDIYVAEVFGDGKVGTPQNLGPTINTTGKEMFPFVNDSILYFASDGHYGMGGLDVFESRRIKDFQFSEPKNLGAPVNSGRDDFSFIIDKEKKYGYLSSCRPGGRGDDDIYYFTRQEPPCSQWVSGKVTNAKYKMAINLADVKVLDKFGDVIASAKTKEDGTYKVEVPCGSKIKVEASKENHTKADKELDINKKNGEETKNVDFELNNYADLIKKEDNVEKVDINPIYFDYDKYAITEQAATELDKVVYVMKNFPAIVIKIESHTDSRGKDDYNLKLSQNRANATHDYIVARGIDASRIESVKGYGETRLRNKCKNGVKCTDAEHALNRRSDFIIVKK